MATSGKSDLAKARWHKGGNHGLHGFSGSIDQLERFSAMYRRFRRGDACVAHWVSKRFTQSMLRTARAGHSVRAYLPTATGSWIREVRKWLLPSSLKFRPSYSSLNHNPTGRFIGNAGLAMETLVVTEILCVFVPFVVSPLRFFGSFARGNFDRAVPVDGRPAGT